jgi:hypothetical protein
MLTNRNQIFNWKISILFWWWRLEAPQVDKKQRPRRRATTTMTTIRSRLFRGREFRDHFPRNWEQIRKWKENSTDFGLFEEESHCRHRLPCPLLIQQHHNFQWKAVMGVFFYVSTLPLWASQPANKWSPNPY